MLDKNVEGMKRGIRYKAEIVISKDSDRMEKSKHLLFLSYHFPMCQ